MEQKDLRTYRRRSVTRESGYHTCGNTTGGECKIFHAQKYICNSLSTTFEFYREKLSVVELFGKGIFIVAFGGYLFSNKKSTYTVKIEFNYEGTLFTCSTQKDIVIEANNWTNIGLHMELPINIGTEVNDVHVYLILKHEIDNEFNFISFDLDAVTKEEYTDASCATSFYQKTYLHIPYLYYLKTDLPFDLYLISKQQLSKGKRIVLKSCNRCGRFLPINIDDELKTLGFSLHCKKRAPCAHSLFRAYEIVNKDDLDDSDLLNLTTEDDKVISYYGHQLECKACKKFFVNAPLNPQRNAQQFKEDGLRRRAIEVLVNKLLNTNLVHFEFEKRTKKEFAKYIWEKFDKRCFKCGPASALISLNEMALDHTMPLAYLYRLDETATCLCGSHNSQKSDHFPVDYYSEDELLRLSNITGLSIDVLHKKEINQVVLNLLTENVIWYFDVFLMDNDYQKVRDGILTADIINDSLKRVISGKTDLAELYKTKTGHYPSSITIK